MAETVYSGSVEPDQANTCEGNKHNNLVENQAIPYFNRLEYTCC
jgi:hypothetical protein